MAKTPRSSSEGLPKWKLVLAAIGVLYIAAFAGWGVYALVNRDAQQGASELAANPNLQNEILAERRVKDVATKLGLSDEQTAALEELLFDFGNRQKEMRRNMPADREAMWESMTALRTEFEAAIDGVLTEGQRAEFESLEPSDRRQLYRGMGPPGRMGRMRPRGMGRGGGQSGPGKQ